MKTAAMVENQPTPIAWMAGRQTALPMALKRKRAK